VDKRTSRPGFVRPVSGRAALRDHHVIPDQPWIGPRTGQQLSLAELAETQRLAANGNTVPFSAMPYTGPKTGDQLVPIEVLAAAEAQQRTGRHAGQETLLRKHGRRVAAFSVVGAAVFVLGVVVQWALIGAGAGSYGSYAGQAVVSIELSWLLNRRFTWADRDVSGGTSLLKWNIQRWTATIPNLALYALLIWAGTGWLVANVATTAVFTAVNYVLGDRWSFTRSPRSGGTLLPPAGIPALPRGPLPSVSIVIPCKGSERTIRATVDSLLRQDYPAPVEVILVGDVGDSTWSALADIGDPRLVLLEQPRVLGKRDPNVKRHAGLIRARGDLLALADSDIVMDRDWLSTGVALLFQQGGGLVAGGMRAIQPHKFWPRFVDRNSLAAKTSRITHPYRITAADFGKRKAPLTANVIFSRDLYRRTPLDAGWAYGYEDYEWMWRVVKDGHKVLMHAALNGAHFHREKFGQLIKEYRRSAQGCAQFVRRHPDSPLARKRRRQATFLPAVVTATTAVAGGAVATGRGMVLALVIVIGLAGLALLEVIRSRSMEAVGYTPAALALGGVFAATLAGNLMRPDGVRTAPSWDSSRGDDQKRRPARDRRWPLAVILLAQAALSLPLAWTNTAFGDEGDYLWGGHMVIAHWLHGTPIPSFITSSYSGSWLIYPPLGAAVSSMFGLAGARVLSLIFMLGATAFLYATAKRLTGQWPAIVAAALWALSQPVLQLTFATYDALSVLFMAAASWLAVESAFRRREGELIAVSAIVLALSNVTAFSSIAIDPVVIAFFCCASAERRGFVRGLQRAAWLAACSAAAYALLMTATHSWAAAVYTVFARQSGYQVHSAVGGQSYSEIAKWAWGATGIIVTLALVGLVCAISQKTRRLLLSVTFCAGLLIPLAQLYEHTGVSMVKHLTLGTWFAAIGAGYCVVFVKRSGIRKIPAITALLCLSIYPAVTAFQAAFADFRSWPNAEALVAALRPLAAKTTGVIFVNGGDGAADIAKSYLPEGSASGRWDAGLPTPALLRTWNVSVVALYFPTTSSSVELAPRLFVSTSSAQEDLLAFAAQVDNAPGMPSLVTYLEGDQDYRLDAEVPYDSDLQDGVYAIWEKVPRSAPLRRVSHRTPNAHHHRKRK
jgi:putative flippase GtrA